MGRKKWILAATLPGLLIIAGWRLGSCYIANLELQDELQDVAAQVGTKIGADPLHSEADLRASVIRRAEKLDIALEPSQITVRRHGEGSEDPIYLSVDYNVRVNLLVCSVSLHFMPSSTRQPLRCTRRRFQATGVPVWDLPRPARPFAIGSPALALRDAGKLEPYEGRTKTATLADAYTTYGKNSKPKSYRSIELVQRVHLGPFFGGMIAERVNSDHLQRHTRERLDAKAATSTMNHELKVFKTMFNHGARADPPKVFRVPRFPARLREPNPRSGFVKGERYAALQAKGKYVWLRAVLAVAYNFGLRNGELLGLRVFQIDLEACTIHLLPGTTKNDKGRAVVMAEDVFKLAAECVNGKKPGDRLFTWAEDKPVGDFRRTSPACQATRRLETRNGHKMGTPETASR